MFDRFCYYNDDADVHTDNWVFRKSLHYCHHSAYEQFSLLCFFSSLSKKFTKINSLRSVGPASFTQSFVIVVCVCQIFVYVVHLVFTFYASQFVVGGLYWYRCNSIIGAPLPEAIATHYCCRGCCCCCSRAFTLPPLDEYYENMSSPNSKYARSFICFHAI